MPDVFKNLTRIFLALLLLFAIHRICFVVFHFSRCSSMGMGLLFRTFYEAVPLDVSTAGYICGISILLLLLQYIFNKKIVYRIHQFFLVLMIFLTTLIAISDIIVYGEMNVKINAQLLFHLNHPSEIFNSAPASFFWIGFAIIFLITFLYSRLLFKYFVYKEVKETKVLKRVAFAIPALCITAIPVIGAIRGGFKQIPINESEVYFTQHQVLNDAAVNPSWTLLHSYTINRNSGNNIYTFMPAANAASLVKDMYSYRDSVYGDFLSATKPNIVFIILESWAGDMVGCCGGEKGITPQVDLLARKGMLFSNCYSSGQLSHQGIPAILSGQPSLPGVSIIESNNKYSGIPCISRDLKNNGYNSSFYFGGQLIYGNIRSYLYYNQFDEIKEETDFAADESEKAKLGIHDEKMFNYFLDGLNQKKAPFFSCLFTISTHSPFGRPLREKFQHGGSRRQYVNSIFYADSCIGDFFSKASTMPWYSNTLFVLVADHSALTPRNWPQNSTQHNHIPLLLYGDAIKKEYQGRIFDHISSQTDIASTLLGQLKIPHDKYRWSKNLLDTAHAFAFYDFYNGYGFVTPKGNLVWDKKAGGVYTTNTFTTGDSTAFKTKGEAYLQQLFQEYIDH